jgi:hypothetical protein
MLLQYDGLDSIGDHDDDCLEYEGEHNSTSSDSDADSVEGNDLDYDGAEVQVAYAERRSGLWVHYKFALEKGSIRWMKTPKECRTTSHAYANGCAFPCGIA